MAAAQPQTEQDQFLNSVSVAIAQQSHARLKTNWLEDATPTCCGGDFCRTSGVKIQGFAAA